MVALGNNGTAFFLDLWDNLPRYIRLCGGRADSGFCPPELLVVWRYYNGRADCENGIKELEACLALPTL